MNVELSITLSKKQEEIIRASEDVATDYIVVKTGRQVGKSTIAQIIGFKWNMQRENVKVGFFLPTYKQCKNIFKRYRTMLTDLIENQMVSFVGAPDFCITFSNGSTIQFFTADNDNFRGNTFDYLIIDEACFIKDEIWSVLEPTVAVSLSKPVGKRGKVLMLSTPKQKNYFYQLSQSDKPNIKVFSFTSEEGGIISRNVIESIKSRTPEHIFRNEYLGEFLDSGAGLFKYIPCIKDVVDKQGHTAAIDLGSKEDWTVLTIMNKSGNVIFTDRWQHQEYDAILDACIKCLMTFGKPLAFIETNGVGQMPFEYCRKNYKGTTLPWVTSPKSKNDIIQKLILDFNTKEITIPNNETLKDELDNYTVEWKNGNPVYEGSNGFHDDYVMSLAICNFNRPKNQAVTATIIKKQSRAGM